jgi:hypothetical protein
MLGVFVQTALADAGNPILGTIKGVLVPDNPSNPSGPVTAYVRGQWNWLSHNSDCNFDRAATGVGIIWNDPSGADNTRTIGTATRSGTTVTITTTAAQTFDVGDHVKVSGVVGGTGFNGSSFVVTARSNTTLKYTSAGTGSGSGGTVTDLDVFNGFKVQNSPFTAYVGTKTATSGNPVDQMVHPVDRGNVPQGFTSGTWMSTSQGYATNANGDYPSGQTFVDPASNNPNDFATWKGGCGREPLTSTGPAVSGGSGNADFINSACAGGGACATHPWGSWGYEKNGGLGYSHHFAQRSDVTTICANFYDVHGGGKFNSGKMQLVNGAKEITVDANGDNSIDTNAFNPAQGANCITFPFFTTLVTGPAVIPNDTATVTTTGSATPTGSMTFDLFAPSDATCAGIPAYHQVVQLSGGSATTTNQGPTPFIASAVGTWRWRLSYGGDTHNPPATSSCGTENFVIAY